MVELREEEAHVLRNRTIPVVHKPDVGPNKQEGEEKETSQGFLGLGDDLRGVGILMILYILQGNLQLLIKEYTGAQIKHSRQVTDYQCIAQYVFNISLISPTGVPLGLASSIPILIQGKIKGYAQQAAFSIVSYPFRLDLGLLVFLLYPRLQLLLSG